jgi:hypothetical protein
LECSLYISRCLSFQTRDGLIVIFGTITAFHA